MVHVRDVDNRPPWFQPCTRANLGLAKLCVSIGYRGRVNLTEKEVSSHDDPLSSVAAEQFQVQSCYDDDADDADADDYYILVVVTFSPLQCDL